MAWTRDWRENKPLGTEDANLTDDYLRYILVDIAERLEDMFYGFNISDATGAEAKYGVKLLKFYKETSDPTQETDYGHFYVKLVSGVPELFYQDDTNTTRQLTSAGTLNVVAGDYAANSIDEDDIQLANDAYMTALDAAGTGTVNLIKAGTNDLPTLPDSAEMASNAAPTEDEGIANKKYIDDQIATALASLGLGNAIFGDWTTDDSDSNAIVKGHGYKVTGDCIVVVRWGAAGTSEVKFEMGTSDPPSDFVAVGVTTHQDTITMPMKKNEYFEVTCAGTITEISVLFYIGGGEVQDQD